MKIRMAALMGRLDVNDPTEKYIAYIESALGNVSKNYNVALLRKDFENIVVYTAKYARLDASRIKFRSELRAREIARVLKYASGDVLIHSDWYHETTAEYLAKKLGCRVNVVHLHKAVGRKLSVDIPKPPGLALTLAHLKEARLKPEEEKALAAATTLYVLLRPRVVGPLVIRGRYDRAILADAALAKFTYRLSYKENKKIFMQDLFKIRFTRYI